MGDKEYLEKTRGALERAFAEFSPDIVLYNAGENVPDSCAMSCCTKPNH